jgi:5,6-dimethylbenzimidazole synthase
MGAALWAENRERGVNPRRAQRCKADLADKMPLVHTGKASVGDDAQSEDRPIDHGPPDTDDPAGRFHPRGLPMEHNLIPAAGLPDSERMGVYHAIHTRRDTRGEFLPDPISDEVLSRLLLAAHHAPSVGFMQPWSFMIIRDKQVKQQVHAHFIKAHHEAALMFSPEQRDTYRSLKLEGILEAPVNICITCDHNRAGPAVIGRTHIPQMDLYSTVCAVQNLWLAARAEGLGLGWVSIFDNDSVARSLGIPDGVTPIAYLCLGKVKGYHPGPELERAGWRRRLPIEDVVVFESWSGGGGDIDLLNRLRSDQAALAQRYGG